MFQHLSPEPCESEASAQKAKLMFGNLSMLDVSNNNINVVPISICEMMNLAVLNISGNEGITELPPQMGLLNRLWNLNTRYQ